MRQPWRQETEWKRDVSSVIGVRKCAGVRDGDASWETLDEIADEHERAE
jgi:hypothetical protein